MSPLSGTNTCPTAVRMSRTSSPGSNSPLPLAACPAGFDELPVRGLFKSVDRGRALAR